jgi:hypothetical protein
MIYKIKKLLPVLLISIIVFSSPIPALAYSYSHVFENVPPATLNWACPLSGWPTVTSSWNTPRGVGTNPHQGVDLSANYVPVYAVWNGWLILVGNYTIDFQIDANNDGIKNDSVYYCEYYHLSAREPAKYYNKGAQIGISGTAGTGPHLHFGGACPDVEHPDTTLWYRNEINYRWTSYWCNGEDLDSFKQVNWNWDNGLNTARITIYFMDDPYKYISPSEVEIFHRKAGTSTWTDGGSMYYKGNYIYEYYFYGKYPSGTTINWLVRIKRSGLSVYSYCWAPAKYDQPDPNPNSTSNPYAYYTNTIQ